MFFISCVPHFFIISFCMSEIIVLNDYIAPPQEPLQYPRSQYTWIEDDEFFDSIVGIDIAGKPVGMGVFIGVRIIISSATPLHQKGWTTFNGNKPDAELEVYAINGAWNKTRRLYVDLVTGNQMQRNSKWVKVGEDSRHTTIFDIFIITLKKVGAGILGSRHAWYPNYLHGYTIKKNYRLYDPMGWKWAAFAFLDKTHVSESIRLAAKYYPYERPLEDCDEWIPRPWGHFICLRNEDNYIGIQNGAGLFNHDQLMGLGAFELNKGNESILVFTDLLLYRHNLNIKFSTTTSTTTTTTTTSTTTTRRWRKKKKKKWGR